MIAGQRPGRCAAAGAPLREPRAAVPLDDQYPWPGQLARRFDGNDDRIFSYDAELTQWRHVPALATFQALGFYWCDVTAADAEFLTRITLGGATPSQG